LKFKSVEFIASIDGVDKTAEYIRHGTKWNVVEKNIKEFAKQFSNFSFNTAISQYTLLDVSRLAKFLIELYNINNKIATRCYSVISPKSLHFLNMPEHHKQKVYEEIDKATEILKPENFYVFVKEINDIKNNLKNTPTIDSNSYFEFTEKLDKLRGENFEDVFGINLR
jgi:sulfatase maturation enzyme AslB (radical SAM superfamily)